MSAYVALALVDVRLEEGLAPLLRHADGDRDVYAILWWKGVPLGARELTREQLASRTAVASLVAETIAPAVGARLFGAEVFVPHVPGDPVRKAHRAPSLDVLLAASRPLSALAPASARIGAPEPSDVSVVIATRARPVELARALASLADLDVRPAEIIVVDNGPDDDTRAIVERSGIARYLAQPRPGLSAARNAGILRARGSIVAFTDDDAVVEPAWLTRLCAGFDGPRVMAVTGLVLPAGLDSPAQVVFEKGLGGLGRGYHERSFDGTFLDETKGYGTPVWNLGAGVNLAVRREAFGRIGLFDERLGAGASGCSEDSELLYRLLADGGECRYVPDAVVRHHHRADPAGLERQMYDYARGHVAALFVQFARHRHLGNLRRAFSIVPRYFLGRLVGGSGSGTGPPRETLRAEMRGYVSGLRMLPLMFREPRRLTGKAPLRSFLRRNPYPDPYTEGFFYREKMRAIHRVAPDRAVADVLEIGGGVSGLTGLLYPGAAITNADVDPVCAASPVNNRPGTTFVEADATSLPFADASFDAVTMFDVLEHVEDDRRAISEACRVLRPAGFLLLTSPNERWRFPYHAALQRICPTEEEMIGRWGHVRRGYSVGDLTRLTGVEPAATATFITPLTAIGHDIGFSRLRRPARRAACVLVAPVTWSGYLLHRPNGPGTETASRWELARSS